MKTKLNLRGVTTFALGLLMLAAPIVAGAVVSVVKPGPFPSGTGLPNRSNQFR